MNKSGIVTIVIIIILIVLGFVFYSGQDSADDGIETADTTREFTVTLRNLSDTQVLSPGVYAVHGKGFNMNYDGELSPAELEPLAEYGSNESYAAFVAAQEGVIDVIPVNAPILPGEELSFSFTAEAGMDLHLSGVQMLVGTNDGIAVFDPIELFEEGGAGGPISLTALATNYDNGTEENEEPLSGFDGGQPDPSRGEENIENGTPTDPQEVVTLHSQITEPVLELVLMADDDEDDDDEDDDEDSEDDEEEEADEEEE